MLSTIYTQNSNDMGILVYFKDDVTNSFSTDPNYNLKEYYR